MPRLRRGQPGARMSDSARGRSFLRCAGRIERVDFHDPALIVGFTAVIFLGVGARRRGIEAEVFIGAAPDRITVITEVVGLYPIANELARTTARDFSLLSAAKPTFGLVRPPSDCVSFVSSSVLRFSPLVGR